MELLGCSVLVPWVQIPPLPEDPGFTTACGRLRVTGRATGVSVPPRLQIQSATRTVALPRPPPKSQSAKTSAHHVLQHYLLQQYPEAYNSKKMPANLAQLVRTRRRVGPFVSFVIFPYCGTWPRLSRRLKQSGNGASSRLVYSRGVWIVKDNRGEFPTAFRFVEHVSYPHALQLLAIVLVTHRHSTN